ncbi:MAG: hypothetical protein HOP19_10370, partial [Acidobacteria bacterium]|nr:hypothetical protein [Acidobacteriota bacterium]
MPRVRLLEEPRFATVEEALQTRNVDELKKLLPHLLTSERATRKDDLVKLIARELSGPRLRDHWAMLDQTQQDAVAETIHSESAVFNPQRFYAKYEKVPNFGAKDRYGWSSEPSRLRLFLFSNAQNSIVPDDLKARLLEFVPKPEGLRLKPIEALPEFIERTEQEYDYDEDAQKLIHISGNRAYEYRQPTKLREVVHQIALTRRDTERAAAQDLFTLLRLIEKGKLTVSEKTFQASAATMKEITALLRDGDFYGWLPKESKYDQEVGPLKAFAWPLLLQAGKLAELQSKKLALTKQGRAALSAPPAETLKLLWQRWLKTKLLDEFSRVDAIKGQQSKGGRHLTAVETRRSVIHEALKHCPVNEWVKFDDFSRYMQAAALDFEITRDSWTLYVSDANYGSLGNGGNDGWDILQARYLMALLFEYAATLGLIDVAYLDPENARSDYADMWGADDLSFLSRYDGLLYFRLNALGAYVLELEQSYTPAGIEAKATVNVLPSLQVNVANLSLDEALLLETWAEKESDTTWRLDRDKAFNVVENGGNLIELREFLAARDEQELPDTV